MRNKRLMAAAAALTASALMAGIFCSCADGNDSKDSNGSTADTSGTSVSAAESTAVSEISETETSASETTAEETSAEDNAGEKAISDIPVEFDKASGFYDGDIELAMSCAAEGAVIRYTTDGSEPDENDDIYSAPIKLRNRSHSDNFLSAVRGVNPSGDYNPKKSIDKANVIRAAAFLPDGSKTAVTSGTYFVGIDRAAKYSAADGSCVPVISLMTDSKNFFDYEKGIYILGKAHDDWLAEDSNNARLDGWQHKGNYSGKGREWERLVTVEYFDAEGRQGFVQDMGIRVMGAASRGEMQKSFRLTARSDYGKKSVKYELIPGNVRSDGTGSVDKYKSFVLRNGGNDCNFARLRDPFLQQLVTDRRFETEQYIPCIVFLDGEYWGMYTLGEDYNDNYIENNYGVDSNNAVVIKRGSVEDGEDEDIELFNEMYDFIKNGDMSDPDMYAKASEMLDMGSFADYCAFNLYIYNEDSIFKDNNWEMWRVRDADGLTAVSDGRWRMMVYDTDYSTGIYCGGGNSGEDNISAVLDFDPVEAAKHDPYTDPEDVSERHPVWLFQSLYKNEDFKRELVNAMCDLRNINFQSGPAIEKLSEVSETFARLVPDTFRRFGPQWVVEWNDPDSYYGSQINGLAMFIDGRYEKMPNIMQKAFDLGEQAELTLDAGSGAVRLNASGTDITGEFEGIYFAGCDITLTAVPAEGSKFLRWEYEGCTASDPSSPEIRVSFGGDFSVKAVFE